MAKVYFRFRSLFFPHFSRRFPAKFFFAGLKLTILSLLGIFLFFTLHGLIFPEDEILEMAKNRILKDPDNPTSYLNLAKIFLERNDFKSAEEELHLAQFFSKKESRQNNVLGVTSPEDIAVEISFWEKIVKEKTDYRDAYLRLAILNYQLQEKDKAKEYLKKAKELDPNFEPAKELEKIIDG